MSCSASSAYETSRAAAAPLLAHPHCSTIGIKAVAYPASRKRSAGARRQLLAALGPCTFIGGSAPADEWTAYGRDQQGTRFSPLKQITPNVARLSRAWEFHTGVIQRGTAKGIRSGFESTPLLVGGRLYLTTPFNRIIALDPETGRQLWSFDPKIDRTQAYGDGFINRGVAAFQPCASSMTMRAASEPVHHSPVEAADLLDQHRWCGRGQPLPRAALRPESPA